MTYNTAWEIESSFDMEIPGQYGTSRRAKTAVMPDIYTNPAAVKKTNLKIVELSLPNIDKSAGFNPYDTGVLQHKKFQS